MADSDAAYRVGRTYRNDAVTADIVQQGTGNAARDINHAGRDINGVYIFTRRLYYRTTDS
jgi:hypothetical protein